MSRVALLLLWAAALFAGAPAGAEPLTKTTQVHAALEAGRYREVEAFYARLRKDTTRTPEGPYPYEAFTYAAYWYSSPDPKDPSHWPKVDAATARWVKHSPRSHVAAMTRAFALAYRAGYMAVRERAWNEADKLADEAANLLERSRGEGRKDPNWHAVRLRVAGVQSLPRADMVALIHEAIRVDATVERVWQEAALALSSEARSEDVVWLMRLAMQRTAETEGTSMYARVLAASAAWFPGFMAGPFHGTGLDWPVLHASFLDYKQRYPAGYHLEVDLHAAMACAARDAEATRALIADPRSAPDSNVWKQMGGANFYAVCKEWAKARPERPRT